VVPFQWWPLLEATWDVRYFFGAVFGASVVGLAIGFWLFFSEGI
jgi:dipeptide/tripeptide permease